MIDRIIDYFENHLFINLDLKFHPDVNLIVKEKDKHELGKLIQLILGISVNCDNKQLYIHEITKLDLSIQQNLMEAIQQLMLNNQQHERIEGTSVLDSISIESNNVKYLKEQLLKTVDTIKQLNRREDELNERNYELQRKMKLNDEERINLQKEIDRLNCKLQTIEQLNSAAQTNELDEHNHHVIKLKAKVDSLEKELIKSDSQKEELQIKIELMQIDLAKLNQQNEDLQMKVKEAKLLKDELDIHRHSADKIAKYEERIDTYKNKLEELSDVRKQVRLLEDKNKLLVESNIELEEEIKKMNLLKSQINDYKKQVSELHQQAIEKTHKIDKYEFDLKKLNEKYDCLLEEKQQLEKAKFELKSQLVSSTASANNLDSNFSLIDDPDASGYAIKQHNLNFEIKSEEVDVKEKLLRLELENKHLKSKLDEANQEDLLLTKANYEDAKQRIVELESDNRNLNRKLIESDSKLNDLLVKQDLNGDESLNKSKLDLVNEEHLVQQLKTELKSLKQRLSDKEHLLARKEEKINDIEEKYKKAVEKAKQVFSVLEPASLSFNGTNSLQSNLTQISDSIINPARIDDPNMYSNLSNEQLKQMLSISNQKFVNLNEEYQRFKNLTDFEQRLMASSVHSLAFSLMRNSATERLKKNGAGLSGSQNSFYGSTNSNLNSSNLSLNNAQANSQSFLTKQRQACSRRINNLEKVSNS